ncbi:unnamed protein product, partial [Ostreobium quekettii]
CSPLATQGIPIGRGAWRPLCAPLEAWHFDLCDPSDEGGLKKLDVCFTASGSFNAVLFWHDLTLWGGAKLGGGPGDPGSSGRSPAVQYMAGELRVEAGDVLPLTCSHNTVRMRFDIEEAEYSHLMKNDLSFPQANFSILADSERAESYHRAIKAAVEKKKKEG